jgi:hypothetical protein
MNAEHAMYKVRSVNEVKDEGNSKWYGVFGCRYVPNPDMNYVGIPDYIVFTIEPKVGKYFISGMITNRGSMTIEVFGSEMETMDGFLNQLKRVAVLFDNAQ